MDTKLHRVQLDISDKTLQEVNSLQEQIEANSRAETIRFAIRITKWLADEKAKGHTFYMETETGNHQIIIFSL